MLRLAEVVGRQLSGISPQQGKVCHQIQRCRLANVVDTQYFHLVFTLPHEMNGWVRLHPRLIYQTLFRSVWETLNTLGHDPKRLNGQLGMTAVLWQALPA